MADPGKTLDDLEPATAEMLTQFLSRMVSSFYRPMVRGIQILCQSAWPNLTQRVLTGSLHRGLRSRTQGDQEPSRPCKG